VPPISACVNTPVCFANNTVNGYSGNNCNTASTYAWDFGDGTSSNQATPPCHTYSAAGTYSVTLSAANSACGSDVKTVPVIITLPSPEPVVSATPVTYCQGKPAVPLSATGTGLLWYTTATGGTGSTVTPTPSTTTAGIQTFYVSQTITGKCESPRVAIVVTVNATPKAPAVTTPVQLCQNQTTIPLTASGTGLLWYSNSTGGTGSATAPTPSTSAIGNTIFYVSQTTNGCEGPRAAISVSVNALATLPLVTTPVIYCQNQQAAPLTATGTGLLWYTTGTNGTGSSTAPIPATGIVGSTTYYVSQTTGCGEGPRAAITVTVNASPSASIAYPKTNLCNVLNSVADPNLPIAVTLTGSPGGTYSIKPATGLPIDATGTVNPSGAVAGTYTISYTIPGTGGCSDLITTAIVNVSSAPSASISYPAVCSSDAAAPVQFTGTQGGNFTAPASLAVNPVTGAITPGSSTPGTYQVTYTITASPPCPGFVTNTSITITKAPSAAISYSLTNLCNVVNTATTPNPPVAVIQTGTAGGSYSILPATGLSISTATGTLDPSAATPGKYIIKYTVTGSGGCSNFSSTTDVTVSGAPTAAIQYTGAPYCQAINTPQEVVLTGNSGGTFSSTQGLSINPSTGEINPALSTPGIYTITYTIAPSSPCPGFITTTTAEITASPAVTFPVSSQAICSGASATFTPASSIANTVYTWAVTGALPAGIAGVSSGSVTGAAAAISLSFTNTGLTSQPLSIQVIPANASLNSCTGIAYNLTLIINPIPPAPVTDTVDFCMGTPAAALTINPLPGNTIKWYDKNFALLNTTPVISTALPAQFTYYASQANANGCEGPKALIPAIVHPTAKIISSSYTNPTTCGIPSGTIVLHVLDINNNPLPNFPLFVHYTKFQNVYSIFDSTDASGKITVPLVAGTYSGIYVETGGCLSQKIPDVFVLKDPSPPAQPVAGYNPPLCSETPLNLTALSATSSQTGSVDYVWVGPAFGSVADTVQNTVITFPSPTVADAGTYIVYAIQNNCISAPTNFQVVIKQSPSKPVINTRSPLCTGDDLSLQAYSSIPGNAVLNYTWTGPGRGFPVNASNAAINNVIIKDAGIYTITVNSPQTGCSSTTDTLILIGGYPIVKFAQDSLTLPTGFLLNLAPVITNAAEPNILPMKSYLWTPSQDLSCNDSLCSSPTATIKNDICYSLKATNIYGCSGSDVICVKVFCQNSQVFIPNAFTPGGDLAENARFMVRASGISSVKSFRVFNRWGKIVFERNNFAPNSPEFGWDGMLNGRLADAGVYVYTAEVVCENGVPFVFKGNVTLL
jgi:gliding motility-associated-like protein